MFLRHLSFNPFQRHSLVSHCQKRLYCVGHMGCHLNWVPGVLTYSMDSADVVIFTSGADIHPAAYGEQLHPETKPQPARDIQEIVEFSRALARSLPMIGIGRGAQLLCALAGGRLVQHQCHPNAVHKMATWDGEELTVPSKHHQAQYPWGLPASDFKLMGWSVNESPFHFDAHGKEMVNGVVEGDKEAEVVYYKKINALCIQFHPHLMWQEEQAKPLYRPGVKWCDDMARALYSGQLAAI
jgi:gamma-glutamyl-gamma-aminobutyrate hydrolase PuuD